MMKTALLMLSGLGACAASDQSIYGPYPLVNKDHSYQSAMYGDYYLHYGSRFSVVHKDTPGLALDYTSVGSGRGLVVDGNRIFGISTSTLYSFDAAALPQIRVLDSVATNCNGRRGAVKDNTLYMYCDGKVRIYDITDPSSLVFQKQIKELGWAGNIQVHGDTMYVMRDWPVRCYMFDITDPVNPVQVTLLNTNSMNYIRSVFEYGGYIYMMGGGVSRIFKKNGMAAPTLIKAFYSGEYTQMALNQQTGVAYVSLSTQVIEFLDLASNPEDPPVIGSVQSSMEPSEIKWVSEGLLILTSNGFSIMKDTAACGSVVLLDKEGTIGSRAYNFRGTNLLPVAMDTTIAVTDTIDVNGEAFMRWPDNIKSLGGSLYRPVITTRTENTRTPYTVSAGTELTFSCCDSSNGCEAFVIVYHCASCSMDQNGGFSGLLALGWDAGSCSPRFDSEDLHPTVTYHKYLAPGEVFSFELTKTVTHFMMATTPKMDDSQWCYKPHGPSPPQAAPCSVKCAM